MCSVSNKLQLQKIKSVLGAGPRAEIAWARKEIGLRRKKEEAGMRKGRQSGWEPEWRRSQGSQAKCPPRGRLSDGVRIVGVILENQK